jgi:hypothetical protein
MEHEKHFNLYYPVACQIYATCVHRSDRPAPRNRGVQREVTPAVMVHRLHMRHDLL